MKKIDFDVNLFKINLSFIHSPPTISGNKISTSPIVCIVKASKALVYHTPI